MRPPTRRRPKPEAGAESGGNADHRNAPKTFEQRCGDGFAEARAYGHAFYARRNLGGAQHDLAAWLTRRQRKYPKLTDWVEENIGSALTFHRLPRQHHKHFKSTNLRERLNEELRRRTRVVRILPNAASRLRPICALCGETHEGWLEDKRYLSMDMPWKARKEHLREAA